MEEDSSGSVPGSMSSDRPLEEIHELLSKRYVRYTLMYLSEQSTTTLERLSDVVAGLESAETETIVSADHRERIRVRLYHAVLPRLDDEGYVCFDTETHDLTEAEFPPAVDALLEATSDTETERR